MAKKPFRLTDAVTRFPEIRENDGIELDSLENGSSDVSGEDEEEAEAERAVRQLNLNGLCKDRECYVDEIVLPGESLQSLSDLRVLSLRSNAIQHFPNSILQLVTLLSLDLSDNSLLTLPPEISMLENLNELVLDQNLLSVLPGTLWELRSLQVLKVASNRLAQPPEMRALILSEAETSPKSDGLTTLNLRANRLKGNIILGNYGNLTELDVSENSIENLDLSAVEQLQILQCSRNSLTHLTLHGKNLTSLIAGNNRLKSLIVAHPPVDLRHLDVSYNHLDSLPDWLSGCSELRSLFASNNSLTTLPDHLFCNEMPYLQAVQLAYNQLQALPTIQRRLPITELFLQNNNLAHLPANLFRFVPDIQVLNVSNNRLCGLPTPTANLRLEKLFLTANCLTDTSIDNMAPYCAHLKILHAAYNSLTCLPERCASFWPDIEELVLSGNKLLTLPAKIGALQHLAVLRVHSNLLQSIPTLSTLTSLRVLDLAHNQLDRIDLTALVPPNLKFLDLSCNTKLHVDSHQFNTYRTQRPMSLVDVSGKNRTSLPLTPSPFCENDLTDYAWSVGFSETAGAKQRLYIAQIRLPTFCNTEALFGMFDGENNHSVPLGVEKVVPRILLEERTVKETAGEYMKYTMLSAHRALKDKGQKQGLSAIICHVMKSKQPGVEYSFCGSVKKYVMRLASVGDIRVVLGRAAGPVRLLPAKQRKQIRTNPQIQLLVPDPDVTELFLDEQDEFMIISNKNLWDVMSPENAIREVTLQRNVILAAKRLQDLAQSYGAEDNLSVIVVKFNLIGTDVDLLMRELRQTIRRNKYESEGCCCETLGGDCASCLEEKIVIPPPLIIDERSSPSGQSEHACSDCNSPARLFVKELNRHSAFEAKSNPERRSCRGVAKALRARRGEEREDSDSALSEEQFKCWEYMLEQNTQLLFDKELNTLNRQRGKSLSRSNPHLSDATGGGFLSKQFGSTRSFHPAVGGRGVGDKKQVMGGPHAAYFGSLQRLMPYNLEYDFAVMHERGLADSLDLDRMQQYWGVATTEL